MRSEVAMGAICKRGTSVLVALKVASAAPAIGRDAIIPDGLSGPAGQPYLPHADRAFHEAFAEGGSPGRQAASDLAAAFSQGTVSPALNYQSGNPAYARAWDDIFAAAKDFYDPAVFTIFVAFEWASLVPGNNLHRNVICREGPETAGQIVPYTNTSPVGSPDPRNLWARLENYEGATGGRVLTISHNDDLSNRMMFALRDDFAEGVAHPLMSSEDEFTDYERWDHGNLYASEVKAPEMLPGEYVRSGLQRGLALKAELGVNPFKLGLVGASDIHTALTTPDNDNFFGKFTAYEPSTERSQHVSKTYADGTPALYCWEYITAGLTAVGAEETAA